MGAEFGWVFIGFIAIVFTYMICDNLKCKHEWEHHCEDVYYPKHNKFIRTTFLVCKKCGKVKVIK